MTKSWMSGQGAACNKKAVGRIYKDLHLNWGVIKWKWAK